MKMRALIGLRTVLRALARGEAGANLVELALVSPVLVLLLAGTVDLGRFAWYSILVSNAARAGVQYGAQNLATAANNAGMQNAALTDGQNVSGLTATATHFCKCSTGGASTCQPTDCSTSHRLTYVQVNTSGTVSTFIQYPGFPASYSVASQAVMRVAP